MEENTLIHARSSSRVGVSDLGVNPDRLDSLISHLKLGGSSSHGVDAQNIGHPYK